MQIARSTVIEFSTGPVAHGQWKLVWASVNFKKIYLNSRINFKTGIRASKFIFLYSMTGSRSTYIGLYEAQGFWVKWFQFKTIWTLSFV
jgi:hypothetical protein